MSKQTENRRAVLAALGAAATAGVLGTSRAEAQAPPASGAAFTPALHEADAWMSGMRGKHRVVLDVATAEHMPDAIRFAGNIFTAHRTAYGVDEADVAMIICLRHGATAYGYGDGIWSRFGKVIDAKAVPPPTGNPYNSGDRMQLADLAKRGVQYMVCGTASRGLASRIAGQGGDVDAVLKEMSAHLIPSARIIAAGVAGVMHAQERGFSLLHVG